MSGGRRAWLRLTLALVALSLLIAAGAWLFFQKYVSAADPNATATAPAPARIAEPPPPAEAVLVGLEGVVERSTNGGEWAEVTKGEKLRANDTIRTGPDARAELEIDGKSSVTITPASEVGIAEVSRAVHRFKLVRGQMTVDYEPDGSRTLRVEGEGAVAETGSAKFSVLAAGGSFAVATITGKVNLEAGGKIVEVDPGKQSVSRAGAPPSLAQPIPAEVLLKVAAAKKVKSGCPPLQGVVQPGSEVRVDGVLVAVNARGAFHHQPPAEGQTEVKLVTRDVAGRTQERVIPCRQRAKPKIEDFAIRWRAPRKNN